MKRFFLLVLIPSVVGAVALPKAVNTPAQIKWCTQHSVKDCIISSCLAGSSTNCKAVCQQNAKNKCAELAKQV